MLTMQLQVGQLLSENEMMVAELKSWQCWYSSQSIGTGSLLAEDIHRKTDDIDIQMDNVLQYLGSMEKTRPPGLQSESCGLCDGESEAVCSFLEEPEPETHTELSVLGRRELEGGEATVRTGPGNGGCMGRGRGRFFFVGCGKGRGTVTDSTGCDAVSIADSIKVKLGMRGRMEYTIAPSVTCGMGGEARYKRTLVGHGNCRRCDNHERALMAMV